MIFDINDFDETLPGPWEWDVKRLAASFVHAGRSNGFAASDQRDAAMACVRSYRKHIAEFSEMRALDVWYARIDMEADSQGRHFYLPSRGFRALTPTSPNGTMPRSLTPSARAASKRT